MMKNSDFLAWMYKTIYRNTHSKKHQHNKKMWPYFCLSRDADNRIEGMTFKDQPLNLAGPDDLRINANKPVVICASGPSVNSIPGRFFDSNQYDFIGVNGVITLANSCAGLNFNYYVIIDDSFILGRLDLVKDIIASPNHILLCNYKVLHAILFNFPLDSVVCKLKIIELYARGIAYKTLGKAEEISPGDQHYYWHREYGFSAHMDRYFFDYGTVAYVALQVAVALGYQKILLAGLDMNNFHLPRFYEQTGHVQPTGLEALFEKIDSAFLTASGYCKAHGIEVINLSPDSAIRSFTKVKSMDYCIPGHGPITDLQSAAPQAMADSSERLSDTVIRSQKPLSVA